MITGSLPYPAWRGQSLRRTFSRGFLRVPLHGLVSPTDLSSSVRRLVGDPAWTSRSYLGPDLISLTKPSTCAQSDRGILVKTITVHASYERAMLLHLSSCRGSYAMGKETGTFHTRQGFPAGHETSRKGPECVKRRPLALRAHPSLSSRPNSVRCLSPLLA